MTRRRRVMKFVLGLVALVLVGLLLYVYTSKENKQPQKQTVHKTLKEVTPLQEEVTSVEKKVSQKAKPVVQHAVRKESLKEVEKTSNSEGKIGEGLTFEGIENADVSDEEKQRMLDQLVYRQGLNAEYEPLSKEDRREILLKNLKNFKD